MFVFDKQQSFVSLFHIAQIPYRMQQSASDTTLLVQKMQLLVYKLSYMTIALQLLKKNVVPRKNSIST